MNIRLGWQVRNIFTQLHVFLFEVVNNIIFRQYQKRTLPNRLVGISVVFTFDITEVFFFPLLMCIHVLYYAVTDCSYFYLLFIFPFFVVLIHPMPLMLKV